MTRLKIALGLLLAVVSAAHAQQPIPTTVYDDGVATCTTFGLNFTGGDAITCSNNRANIPVGGGTPDFPLLAPDGSNTAPSYSFTNGTNFGIYFNSATGGSLRFTANGQNAVTMTSGIFTIAEELDLATTQVMKAGANTVISGDKLQASQLAIASQATGDVLVASSATAWTRVGIGQPYFPLQVDSVGTGLTYGLLPVAGGGTGTSDGCGWYDCGDGADGNTTISSTVTLTSWKNYGTLTVDTTPGILKVASFPIHATGTVTVNNGGIIQNDGNVPAAGCATIAAGVVSGFYPGSQAGAAGGCAAVGGAAMNTINAHKTGSSGAGGAGSSTAGGAASTSSIDTTGGFDSTSSRRPWSFLVVSTTFNAATNLHCPQVCVANENCTCRGFGAGGSGGGGCGGGCCGAVGGSGGGITEITAPQITVDAGGTIRANGGAGGSAAGGGGCGANAGGGGGGQGGIVRLFAPPGKYSNSGTVQASGGAGGAKSGTGVAGSTGGTGVVATPGN